MMSGGLLWVKRGHHFAAFDRAIAERLAQLDGADEAGRTSELARPAKAPCAENIGMPNVIAINARIELYIDTSLPH
jgi:hypothetical protein